MEAIIQFVESLVPPGFEIELFLKAAVLLLLGIFVIGVIGRLLFGKGSTLSHCVSSAISILFIYAVTVVIYSFGVNLEYVLSPLPFVDLAGDYLIIQIYDKTLYLQICDQVLSMIILAFLANLADSWLLRGKHLIGWFFFRCLSVMIAMILHLIASALINALLPQGLLTWAPMILLGLLIVLLLTGALKIVVGALLGSVHPLIGILYTFFFANIVGKQITKAVLTTAILAGIVFLLNQLGATVIYIASSALAAYAPFLLLLLVIWYIVGRKF